jgi:hypothetical protein
MQKGVNWRDYLSVPKTHNIGKITRCDSPQSCRPSFIMVMQPTYL